MNPVALVLGAIGLLVWIAGTALVVKARRDYYRLREAGLLQGEAGETLPTWQRIVLGKKAEMLPPHQRRWALQTFVLITGAAVCLLIAWAVAFD